MTQNHLDELNPSQKEAVTTTDGPLLVLAGAGSGKTRVITHRVAHLVHNGVAPRNILAVTFTNKAAKEMRERITNLLRHTTHTQPASYDETPTISTFHALGVRIIREHHDVLGLKKHFSIFDRSDSNRCIKAALERGGYNPKQFEPRKILSMISRAKGNALTRIEFQESASSYPEEVAAHVWEHYERMLREEHALDFDDLLITTLTLLRNYPPIKEKYQTWFQYIHVDEYQDTNKVQFEIIKLFGEEHQNICAVGDVDQNIYSWRGADTANIMQFEKQFRGAQTIFLEENYRSTKTIVSVSNTIIEKNKNRLPKTAFTSNHDGEKIGVYGGFNERDEAQFIATTIKDLLSKGVRGDEIAVLFRANFQSRALEEACMEHTIPYHVLGTRFFDRKEVKDIISYIRLAQNSDSIADLTRVINTPARGIGKVTLLKLIEGKRDTLNAGTEKKVAAFYEIMRDIESALKEKPLSESIKLILKKSGVEASFKNDGEEGLERLENLRELVSIATRYDHMKTEEAVDQFLEDVALQTDQDTIDQKEREGDRVKLMTVHAAKGLEFPYVFITGLEEGLFPHEKLSEERVDMEEERRLFYVALTRAEKKLFLTYAHTRTVFGSTQTNIPSSFFDDIDDMFIEPMNPTPTNTPIKTIYLD